MENDHTTENIDSTNDETVDTTDEQSTEQTEDSTDEVEGVKEDKKELTPAQKLGAIKRQEKKLLRDNPDLLQDKTQEKAEKSAAPLSREESFLIAKGVSLEGLDKINRISNLDGVSVMEAYESEDYAIWVEKQERIEKQKASQLESTRGGGRTQKTKTLDTPGLTQAERKALVTKKRQELEGKR